MASSVLASPRVRSRAACGQTPAVLHCRWRLRVPWCVQERHCQRFNSIMYTLYRYKSASWCAYMQTNYFSIERTIYRQLDATVLLLQRRLPTERDSAHLALWLYGPRLVLCMLREISYYNSTYGLRPSHYTPLRMETGLTATLSPA